MIEILLATYNGEKYLDEQIKSILSQTFRDFKIIIRDDGSKDGTVDIIKRYAENYPDKIVFIEDEKKGGSAAKNFFLLISYASAEYIMFCDQDDVWLPNKIEITYNAMKKLEKKTGNTTPLLVFASYRIVDSRLRDVAFKERNNQISRYNLDFSHLLVQNYVTGCLMMCNKTLYSKCGGFDTRILMHDWWLALIASSSGVIKHIPDVVMLYRQHRNNEVGAVDVKNARYVILKFLDKNTVNMKYLYLKQAMLFKKRYESFLPKESAKQLNDFILLYRKPSKIQRMCVLLKGRYLKSDFVRIVGQLWYI